MKKIFLIRHAKSSWSDPSVTDFHRKLNKRGKRDAPFMAAKLSSYDVLPTLVLSSPAYRAKVTAEFMAKEIGIKKKEIVFKDEIYSASLENLYFVARGVEDSHEVICLVGHNYVITDFGEQLTNEVLHNIPTSGIVGINLNIETWKELTPGCGKVFIFDFPKKYFPK